MSKEITSLNSTLEELDQLKGKLEIVNKTSLTDLNQSISTLSSSIGSLGGKSTEIFATMITGITSFYSAIMANPFAALATLIGTLAVAVITTSDNIEELSVAEKENAEQAQKLIDKYQGMIDEQTELNDSFSKSSGSISGEYAVASQYLNELYKMMENGKPIENLETAKFYISELNKMGIDGISIIDQRIIALEKEKSAYETQIEQLQIKAMLQAHEEAYGQALLNQQSIIGNLADAKQKLNIEEEKSSTLLTDYLNKNPDYYSAVNACAMAHGAFGKELATAKDNLVLVHESLVKNEEALNTQEALIALQSGSLQKQAIANIDLALSYDEVVGASEQMTYKWNDLQSQLSIFDEQMKAHEDGTKMMSQTEIEQNKYSRDYIINCMAQKGVAMSMTYDEMTQKLGDSYIEMTKVERENLEEQYNGLVNKGNDKSVELIKQKNNLLQILESQGIEANSKVAKQHMDELMLWQSQGSNCGREYINKITGAMVEGKPQMQKTGTDLNNSAAFGFESKSAVLKIDTSNANRKISDTAKKAEFDKTASVGVNYTSKFAGILVGGIEIPIKFSMCAEGGFPESGQLFVAREAGPELVGRINGKTAVANNDQIVSGISSGVYNAVRSAMSGNGGSAHMNIHATFVMDGEVVGKQVIKYHNGVVKRTGTTPLMI